MTEVFVVVQRCFMFQTFLIAQKEVASNNSAEVFQLVQLMAWWNFGWSPLVHITLYHPTTTILSLLWVVALWY